mgnify:CR=1 FL=1|jgi:hypothetical protein
MTGGARPSIVDWTLLPVPEGEGVARDRIGVVEIDRDGIFETSGLMLRSMLARRIEVRPKPFCEWYAEEVEG